MLISYSTFCNILTHFKDEDEFADKFRTLLYQYDKREFIDPDSFHDFNMHSLMLDVLEEIFQDKNHWIAYYIYELDYGNAYKPGMINYDDGRDVPLRTPQDLWNLLMENLNENF